MAKRRCLLKTSLAILVAPAIPHLGAGLLTALHQKQRSSATGGLHSVQLLEMVVMVRIASILLLLLALGACGSMPDTLAKNCEGSVQQARGGSERGSFPPLRVEENFGSRTDCVEPYRYTAATESHRGSYSERYRNGVYLEPRWRATDTQQLDSYTPGVHTRVRTNVTRNGPTPRNDNHLTTGASMKVEADREGIGIAQNPFLSWLPILGGKVLGSICFGNNVSRWGNC